MIGQSRQYINVYKDRGVLIRDETTKKFDLDNPINKQWFDQMRKSYIEKCADPNYIPQKTEKIKKVKEVKTHFLASTSPHPSQRMVNDDEPDDEPTGNRSNLQERKLQAEVTLKELGIKKAKIEIEQKQGKLLNIDTAKGIVSAYMSSYSKGLFRDIETWMHRILDIHKISLEDKAEYIAMLEGLMNAASGRTIKELEVKLKDENTQL